MQRIFILIFLLAGVLGHDPWKQDETYSFGIIYHFLQNHEWLIPFNDGSPFMEKPPLYYWTAVIFCKIFWFLPLHDAARLTSSFYMIIAIIFVWKTSEVLFHDKEKNELSILLFLGTLGVVRHSHDMFTDIALLAGSSIAFYGLVLSKYNNKLAGFWFGLGIGIAFMSKGFFTPVILGTTAIIVLRKDGILSFLSKAFVAASPFLLGWAIELYKYSPKLFMEWFWDNNIGRFLGFSVPVLGAGNEPFYIIYSAIWFAFPTFPLAVYFAIKNYKDWQKPQYILPVTISVLGLGLLLASASARALYLLPLMPAFTMLAVQIFYTKKEWIATPSARNDGVPCELVIARQSRSNPDKKINIQFYLKIFFGFGLIVILSIWICLLNSLDLFGIGKILPVGFMPTHKQIIEVLVSIIGITYCVIMMRFEKNIVKVWFIGIASLWILTNTLLLTWTDETKSYRPILSEMNKFIANSPYNKSCLSYYNLGESIEPMLLYFNHNANMQRVENLNEVKCDLLLTLTSKNAKEDSNLLWKGSRVLDAKDEQLRLYKIIN